MSSRDRVGEEQNKTRTLLPIICIALASSHYLVLHTEVWFKRFYINTLYLPILGKIRTYIWQIPERTGPTSKNFECIPWFYYSTVNLVKVKFKSNLFLFYLLLEIIMDRRMSLFFYF